MKNIAIIGSSGFVGKNLTYRAYANGYQDADLDLYRSSNIEEIENKEYDVIYCAGIPGSKRYANQNPADDMASIAKLIKHVSKVKCKRFILISTIDVYFDYLNGWYGKNRLTAEKILHSIFKDSLYIFRLPMLFGSHMKKGIFLDLLQQNNFGPIYALDQYQWYFVDELWDDIDRLIVENPEKKVFDLFSEPIILKDVIEIFPESNLLIENSQQTIYDIQTGGYFQTKDSIFQKMKEFLRILKNDILKI